MQNHKVATLTYDKQSSKIAIVFWYNATVNAAVTTQKSLVKNACVNFFGKLPYRHLCKCYLQSFRATRHCCKDVIGVHCAQDEVGSVPGFEAISAKDSTTGPALQASHAHGRQVTGLALILDLKQVHSYWVHIIVSIGRTSMLLNFLLEVNNATCHERLYLTCNI